MKNLTRCDGSQVSGKKEEESDEEEQDDEKEEEDDGHPERDVWRNVSL